FLSASQEKLRPVPPRRRKKARSRGNGRRLRVKISRTGRQRRSAFVVVHVAKSLRLLNDLGFQHLGQSFIPHKLERIVPAALGQLTQESVEILHFGHRDFGLHNLAALVVGRHAEHPAAPLDRKSTRLNSSHVSISYAVFCLKKK